MCVNKITLPSILTLRNVSHHNGSFQCMKQIISQNMDQSLCKWSKICTYLQLYNKIAMNYWKVLDSNSFFSLLIFFLHFCLPASSQWSDTPVLSIYYIKFTCVLLYCLILPAWSANVDNNNQVPCQVLFTLANLEFWDYWGTLKLGTLPTTTLCQREKDKL